MEPDNQGLAAGLPQPSRLNERIIIAESLILAERSTKVRITFAMERVKDGLAFVVCPASRPGS